MAEILKFQPRPRNADTVIDMELEVYINAALRKRDAARIGRGLLEPGEIPYDEARETYVKWAKSNGFNGRFFDLIDARINEVIDIVCEFRSTLTASGVMGGHVTAFNYYEQGWPWPVVVLGFNCATVPEFENQTALSAFNVAINIYTLNGDSDGARKVPNGETEGRLRCVATNPKYYVTARNIHNFMVPFNRSEPDCMWSWKIQMDERLGMAYVMNKSIAHIPDTIGGILQPVFVRLTMPATHVILMPETDEYFSKNLQLGDPDTPLKIDPADLEVMLLNFQHQV